MKSVYSINNVLIRLTDERWLHITENHDDLAGRQAEVLEIVAEPDIIVKGGKDEFLAARQIHNKWLIIAYKELDNKDGFIITAFETSKIQYLLRKEIIWKKQS